MPRYDEFTGGSYTSQSPVTDAERTVNWSDMFPRMPFGYCRNILKGYFKLTSDIVQRNVRISQAPDFSDIIVAKFRRIMGRASLQTRSFIERFVCMHVVFFHAGPFQISRYVVDLLSILMVNRKADRTWTNECFGYHDVQFALLDPSILAKVSGYISINNLSLPQLTTIASQSPAVAHFVEVFISDYCSPLFHEYMVPEIGAS